MRKASPMRSGASGRERSMRGRVSESGVECCWREGKRSG